MAKALHPTHPNFQIIDKFTITSRAAIEISNRCPENYKHLILECINHGWIKPIAYVTDEEYMVMKLTH